MKKIVSVLLCLVMMMSLCTAAFAAATDTTEYCNCASPVSNSLPEDNNDGATHHFNCMDCGKRVAMKDEAHTWDCDEQDKYVGEGGTTCLCGAKKPVATKTYKVEYVNDADKLVPATKMPVDSNEYAIGDKVTLKNMPATTIPEGYTFAGWFDGVKTFQPGDEVPVGGDMTFTLVLEKVPATKTYKVEYVRDADKLVPATKMPVDSKEYAIGDKVTLMKMPAPTLPEGYTFAGWFDGLKTYQPGDEVPVGGNMKFTLVLEKVPATTFTVTYVAGKSGVTSMPVDTNAYKANTIVTIKGLVGTSTVPEGYTFAGWTTDGNDFYEAGETVRITGNLVLTPVLVKQTADCDHMGNHWDYKSIDDTHHSVTCHDCGTVVTESTACVFKGDLGPCACVCGNTCKHTSYIYKVSEDGKTHEGYCADCGKRIKTEDGEHELTYVNNKNGKNGTHSATCDKCGALVVDHEKHVFKGNKCTLCGAKKSASSGGSTTGTTTATTKSPKTGDMGVVLYAATALLSLSGTAVVIKKRKNDK